MEIEFVPISMFVSLAVIVSLYFYFRFKTRREFQQTLRSAIENGQALTPEVLDRLGEPKRGRGADLRRGVIAMAIGLGFAAFGAILGEEDAVQPLLAIGAFPFVVGLAYLGLWKFREPEK
jgi:hypothetical protein